MRQKTTFYITLVCSDDTLLAQVTLTIERVASAKVKASPQSSEKKTLYVEKLSQLDNVLQPIIFLCAWFWKK